MSYNNLEKIVPMWLKINTSEKSGIFSMFKLETVI